MLLLLACILALPGHVSPHDPEQRGVSVLCSVGPVPMSGGDRQEGSHRECHHLSTQIVFGGCW